MPRMYGRSARLTHQSRIFLWRKRSRDPAGAAVDMPNRLSSIDGPDLHTDRKIVRSVIGSNRERTQVG